MSRDRSRLGLLLDRDFRRLFAATTVSQFGYQVSFLALPLVAVETLAVNEFEVGILTALTTAAFLLVGLPAGAWVDRMRRRRVLIAGDVGRAILLATVPAAWWAGMLTLWQLYAVALLHGILTVFFDVAYQSYLPHLVGRANLVEGNSRLESVRALSHVGGPGAAGSLIQVVTAPVALLADAVALALSAVFVVRITKREERPRRPDTHLVRDIGEGLRFVLGHRLLRSIAACTSTANLCSAATGAMVIFFLRRDLGLGAGVIGLVLSVAGIGGVVGALVARRFAAWVGQGPAIWLSVCCTAPFALLLPLAEPGWRIWLAAAGGAVFAVGVVVYNVTQVSFRQAVTPDHLLGRMNATMRFLVWGTQPIGGILGGVLGSAVGARTTLVIGAVGGSLAFLPALLSPLRTMRELPSGPENHLEDPLEVQVVERIERRRSERS
ncbi:MFS transporter [Actinopolymorpha sp. B9G3]|uniref:MFS transporter n=1 Tax=Actinopolymorpha sp. B9G3 TaxID=3158970 RepID=UPI0032D8FA6D